MGETVDKFRTRWNNYRAADCKVAKGEIVMQQSLHVHFAQSDHNGFLKDCMIKLIDKTDAKDPTRRERFWIYKLQTLTPKGLNIDIKK